MRLPQCAASAALAVRVVVAGTAVVPQAQSPQRDGSFCRWYDGYSNREKVPLQLLQRKAAAFKKPGTSSAGGHAAPGAPSGATCETLAQYSHHLEQTFGEHRAARLRAAASSLGDRAIYLYISTRDVVCILDSTWQQAWDSFRGRSVLHAALDPDAHQYCVSRVAAAKARGVVLACVDVSGWLPASDRNGGHGPRQDVEFGSCAYRLIVWSKPLVLLHVSAVVDALFLDTDILIWRGPEGTLLDWVEKNRKASSDLLVSSVFPGFLPPPFADHRVNTGVLFAKRSSAELIRGWLGQAPSVLRGVTGDQEGLRTLLREQAWARRAVQQIPHGVVSEYANGGQYGSHFTGVPDKAIAMQQQGRWKPQLPGCQATGFVDTPRNSTLKPASVAEDLP